MYYATHYDVHYAMQVVSTFQPVALQTLFVNQRGKT